MSEDRRDAHGEAKTADAQGAAPKAAQGKGAGGSKPGDGDKPTEMGAFDVKMGAFDVKMGFGVEVDDKK